MDSAPVKDKVIEIVSEKLKKPKDQIALESSFQELGADSLDQADLVMEFDPSEQRYKLDQNRSELMQADQEITKARADAAVVAAQDKVALLKARFDVRRAELDVLKNELVSSIDARKNDLALEQANRVLAELEQDVKSRSASGEATPSNSGAFAASTTSSGLASTCSAVASAGLASGAVSNDSSAWGFSLSHASSSFRNFEMSPS